MSAFKDICELLMYHNAHESLCYFAKIRKRLSPRSSKGLLGSHKQKNSPVSSGSLIRTRLVDWVMLQSFPRVMSQRDVKHILYRGVDSYPELERLWARPPNVKESAPFPTA